MNPRRFSAQVVRVSALILILALVASINPHPAQASSFVVDRTDDDPTADACTGSPNDCSLRGAIIKANASFGADLITVPAGTYTLTIPGTNEPNSLNGDLDINEDLTITGAGAATTIIDGNGSVTSERVLEVTNSSATVVIEDVTIKNGDHTQTGSGGGIFHGGSLTLRNSVITQNSNDTRGGGIYSSGDLFLDNTEVTGNSTPGSGAGIYNASGSQLSIVDSLIDNNHSTGGLELGGGLYHVTAATISITDTDITNNSADDGGGLAFKFSSGSVNLTRVKIDGNSANASTSLGLGGGIYFDHTGTIEIDESSINGNTAPNGGGIYLDVDGGTLSINRSSITANQATDILGSGGGIHARNSLSMTTSTVSGNSADHNGAGIYQYSFDGTDDATLSNLTITNNTADADSNGGGSGGGIFVQGAPVTLSNSIIGGNQDEDCDTSSGSFTSSDYNVDSDGSCNLTNSNDQSNVDPGLGPLADNGGTTSTHLPLPGSPAINLVPSGVNGCGTTYTLDQRGWPRPIGDLCEAGAVEAPVWIFMPLIVK